MRMRIKKKSINGSALIKGESVIATGSMLKNLPASAGDIGDTRSVHGWGRSPAGGNDSLIQYSCLGNSMTEGPSGLQPIGSQRVGHDFVTKHTQIIAASQEKFSALLK